jgi:hypothetical protein
MSQYENTPRDLKIYQYVKEHPGSSQEDVVRGMKGDPSRITVIKSLERLEEYKMIIFETDKPNSQIYRIYVNNDNLLVSIERTLAEFKKSFFVLLDHLRSKIDKNYSEGRSDVKVKNMTPALYEVLKMHQWAIYASIPSGLHWKWIRQAPDKETLDRLHHVVLHSILEVEETFSDFFFHLLLNKSKYGSNLDIDKILPPDFPPPLFVNPDVLPKPVKSIKIFGDYGLRAEAVKVWQSIDKFREENKK